VTLDHFPLDSVGPAGRIGSTINVAAAAVLSVFGFVSGAIPFSVTAMGLCAYFGVLCVRAWRGDYDNMYTFDVIRNPFGPSQPRNPRD
jgi:hypothetical protein